VAPVAGEQSQEYEAPRYHRVLVAIDGSAPAAFAMRHAVGAAVRQRSHLTLLTVVPGPTMVVAAAGVSPERLASQIEAEAAKRLRDIVAELPRDLSVTHLVRHGHPAEQILGLLAEKPFDLLCMGARGRGRLANALLGSVSAAVLRRSPVAVVVFHPPREAA
jgi:universal stress protein A